MVPGLALPGTGRRPAIFNCLGSGLLALEINNTPPTARLQCLLQIFTIFKRRFSLNRSIGLGQVLHHVSSLNKAWLQRDRSPQHRLVLVSIRPANGVVRHTHLDREPMPATGRTDSLAHYFIRQVPVSHWRPVVLATAIRAIHWGLGVKAPPKRGQFNQNRSASLLSTTSPPVALARLSAAPAAAIFSSIAFMVL